MTLHSNLLARNRDFAASFSHADMPILPKLRTVVVACGDARVDPAHVLGLELGDAVVIRNNGGRVTPGVIDEVAALAFLVNKLTQGTDTTFNVVLMQHTHCGAERFADPALQQAMKQQIGVDVSEHAITNQAENLLQDLNRLRDAVKMPDYMTVSALLYDLKTGEVSEIAAQQSLSDLRQKNAPDDPSEL